MKPELLLCLREDDIEILCHKFLVGRSCACVCLFILNFQINKVLDCGLDRRTIEVLLELIEAGVHPEALADGE